MDNNFKLGVRKAITSITIIAVILLIGRAITYVCTLDNTIGTLQHELDYMKYRIDELEKNH